MDYYLNPVDPVLGGYHSSATQRKLPPKDFDGQVGMFSAIDVATGEKSGLIGSAQGCRFSATTGGLVFVSDDARRFRAFDADSGEVLWEQI